MRYHALACDYDGTIANDGRVSAETLEALRRVAASGRRLVLVTGRELEDLLRVLPDINVFDRVVAENGALLYCPSTREERVLASGIRPDFAETLRVQGVEPVSQGRVIVATCEPHENTVLELIREMGLELQVIFNKGAVMVLPSGVNKASGLKEALDELGLTVHNVVGVGDAENDHAFLSACELSVAVANALPAVQERCDIVTKGARGEGVVELIDALVRDDLDTVSHPITRHHLVVGYEESGEEITMPPWGKNLLFAGSAGGGKSTLAKGFIERLMARSYQYCVMDPEGDYEDFEGGIVLGDRERVPKPNEVLQVLERGHQNAIVNLLGVALDERPAYFARLLSDILECRSETGRPHWLVLDEAHHLLPWTWEPAALTLPHELSNIVFISHRPDQLAPKALEMVDFVFVVGKSPEETIRLFTHSVGEKGPKIKVSHLETGQGLLWERGSKEVRTFKIAPTRFEHRRHRRKYAEGDLGPELSFYFRGPDGRLKLQSQNLALFVQLAEGVDDETWNFHLRQNHYSEWFRNTIKDEELARETEAVEADQHASPLETRRAIRTAIEKRYTIPSAPTRRGG
jgi:HAD superfamily hydrolase (TIGR01484 family)